MQSPLTPQRGRIESNPREYTHMECPARDELVVMLAGSRCILAVRIAQGWKSGRPPDERGKSDGIAGKKPKIRPIIHAHFPAVRLSTLIHRPYTALDSRPLIVCA